MTPLHLWIAHFPVAPLVTGAAADLLGAAWHDRLDGPRGWLLAAALLAALLALGITASGTGISHAG